MNILDPSAKLECTSCQLCATMCPCDAIHIELNENGFYRPVVDSDRCTDCGLCTKVCYKFDEDVKITKPELIEKTHLYAAWSNDDEIVRNTTSGGIGDVLAHELLKQGYKVVGCVYDEEKIRAEHRIATEEGDLVPFRGSKYIQSYTFVALKEVVRNCRHEKYAVFGTPCQIYALNRIAEMKRVRDQFVFVDFYCHGCPSHYAWNKYQAYIKEKIGVKRFDKVEFRSKIKGWGTFIVAVYGKNRKLYNSSNNLKGFYDLFFCDQILNDGCHDCLLRGTLEYTDIRMGDFWGKKFLKNTRGVSGVSVVTERGRYVFDAATRLNVTTQECEYKDFLPWQSYGKIYQPRPEARRMILESLRDANQDVWDACKVVYRTQTSKERLVRYVKNILALFPISVMNRIKKIM